MQRFLLGICLMLLLAVSNICLAAEQIKDEPANAETITLQEMQDRLNSPGTDLYLKLTDDEVLVYKETASSRSLRKQIILTAATDKILRLYTNDEKTFKQMSKMLRDYESDKADFGGYRIITDMDNVQTLDNGQKVYRFWFMKVKTEKSSSRVPIGIGIGIGGGHHHGPWIGIGL